jgi:hypothetical protein
LAALWGGIGQPIADCCSGLFGDLELDWPPIFLLDYLGAVLHSVPDAYVPHPEPHEVAAPQLAVDGEIEQREVAATPFKLEPDANYPDLLRSQRTFLTSKATLVPGSFGKADK